MSHDGRRMVGKFEHDRGLEDSLHSREGVRLGQLLTALCKAYRNHLDLPFLFNLKTAIVQSDPSVLDKELSQINGAVLRYTSNMNHQAVSRNRT